jgi:hypothetical protein
MNRIPELLDALDAARLELAASEAARCLLGEHTYDALERKMLAMRPVVEAARAWNNPDAFPEYVRNARLRKALAAYESAAPHDKAAGSQPKYEPPKAYVGGQDLRVTWPEDKVVQPSPVLAVSGASDTNDRGNATAAGDHDECDTRACSLCEAERDAQIARMEAANKRLLSQNKNHYDAVRLAEADAARFRKIAAAVAQGKKVVITDRFNGTNRVATWSGRLYWAPEAWTGPTLADAVDAMPEAK